MESVGDTMLVSEAIKTVRRRVNDEYDSGYSDDDIIGYLNDAIKYLASAMIVRCDPVLIKEYDIVIEQFRPGVMHKLGLGYEDLKDLEIELEKLKRKRT